MFTRLRMPTMVTMPRVLGRLRSMTGASGIASPAAARRRSACLTRQTPIGIKPEPHDEDRGEDDEADDADIRPPGEAKLLDREERQEEESRSPW